MIGHVVFKIGIKFLGGLCFFSDLVSGLGMADRGPFMIFM